MLGGTHNVNSRRTPIDTPGFLRIGFLIFLTLSMAPTEVSAAPMNAERFPPPGNYVWAEEIRFHINCSGAGRPTVILDAGLGGSSLEWVKVQPAVSGFTRVCSYDRAGYGWSGRSRSPRTAKNIVGELRSLLTEADTDDPYVLVGHSFGGLTARLFAHEHPEQVAGLVLVDASHERLFEQFDRNGSGSALAPTGAQFVISNHETVPANLPEDTRAIAEALALGPDSLRSLYGELLHLRESARQAQVAFLLPDVPLAVVARDGRAQANTRRGLSVARIWLELQKELANRVPESTLVVTRESGHHIHLDQPELVVRAIRGVVIAARKREGACAPTISC